MSEESNGNDYDEDNGRVYGGTSKNDYAQDDPEDDLPDSVQGQIDTLKNS